MPRGSKRTVPLMASSSAARSGGCDRLRQSWRCRRTPVAQRPVDRGVSSRVPEPRHVEKIPCRIPRLASPERDGNPLVVERNRATDGELGVVADELKVLHPYDVLIERQPNGTSIPNGVVEQRHVQSVDRAVHQQVIDVGELADDVNRAVGDRRRVRRQLRHEQSDVGVERAIVKSQAELRVGVASSAMRPVPVTAESAATSISPLNSVRAARACRRPGPPVPVRRPGR